LSSGFYASPASELFQADISIVMVRAPAIEAHQQGVDSITLVMYHSPCQRFTTDKSPTWSNSMSYTITAGGHSTDLGIVGRAPTLYAAKRLGRAVVRKSLPNGCGGYRVWDDNNRQVAGESRTIRTDYRWSTGA
jgi:hypothetical protein